MPILKVVIFMSLGPSTYALTSDEIRNLQNGDAIVVSAKDDSTINKAIADARRVTGKSMNVTSLSIGSDNVGHYTIKADVPSNYQCKTGN